MVSSLAVAQQPKADPALDFYAIIIGAGVSGLYQLYKLRELGLKVPVAMPYPTIIGPCCGAMDPRPGAGVTNGCVARDFSESLSRE